MMMVTTPIFYVNGPPHIGHLYSAVLADALSRWHKMQGRETHMVTGTDEHGMKVFEAATKHDMSTISYCDFISDKFKTLFDRADVKYDEYMRTTSEIHHTCVTHLWNTILANGYLYEGSYDGWYCVSDEAFLTNNQVRKREDGVHVSIESGHVVDWVSEKNWIFKLSAFQKQIEQWISSGVILGQSANSLKRLLESGLNDLSVSRPRSRIKWGIQVPNDPSQTIYVWLDALGNYLTATGYPDKSKYSSIWPADFQIIGKDIIRFHCIYWPAFLMAAGMTLPSSIIAHAHWTVGHEKMSKSKGNVIDPHCFIDKFGIDAVRYFLLREGGLADDGD
eukprot:TRINITY_DN8334_c0_g1_i2.p1 TRINITY_DN8334_c0_g1~~TRINITY_DN8334_c0_g1_i2.p1  ORF type:complete len:334 (+),score=65.45 TRINITY_DN8334_c0_g1_i2:190-1191(+)